MINIFKNRAVYEIIWKNIVEPGSSQMTIGACPLHAGYPRLQHILILFNTYCFCTVKWLHEGASILRYSYIAYLAENLYVIPTDSAAAHTPT